MGRRYYCHFTGKVHKLIDTTPAWKPVVKGRHNLEKSGRLVINVIRKEEGDKDELLKLSYEEHLWLEKEIRTVAKVTAADVEEFLQLAAEAQIKPAYQLYSLEEANEALWELKNAKIHGAKVLQVSKR